MLTSDPSHSLILHTLTLKSARKLTYHGFSLNYLVISPRVVITIVVYTYLDRSLKNPYLIINELLSCLATRFDVGGGGARTAIGWQDRA